MDSYRIGTTVVVSYTTAKENVMIRNTLVFIILTPLFLGCGTTKQSPINNAVLDDLMAQQRFKIQVRAVAPQVTQTMAQVANSGILPPGNSISRIDVTGEGYFMKVHGDSVTANLPYYGERQMGGGYNSDLGIQFNGVVRDLEIIKDEEKYSYHITFNVNGSSETYFLSTTVGKNFGSTIFVRSSHRNSIRYTGDVKAIKKH